jgi:hypothetical protein
MVIAADDDDDDVRGTHQKMTLNLTRDLQMIQIPIRVYSMR